MRYLNKPLNYQEKSNLIDMLIGCKNRICVTDDIFELVKLQGYACEYISLLAQNRLLELELKQNDWTYKYSFNL